MLNIPKRDKTVVNQAYDVLLSRVLKWAEDEQPLRAIIQVGSRARADHPADKWSDLDLMLYLTHPEDYLQHTDWLEKIAPIWMMVSSRTTRSDPELLVMFEGGYKMDFVLCPVGYLQWLRDHAGDDVVFQRGARVVFDRDGLAASIPLAERHIPVRARPTADEFNQTCQTMCYISVYIARQARRGDLWLAKMREAQRNELLLRMLEWHAGAKSGWRADTWHHGRFMQQWADPRAVAAIGMVFSTYESESIHNALIAALDLFSWMGRETAQVLGHPYPDQAEVFARALIDQALGSDPQPPTAGSP